MKLAFLTLLWLSLFALPVNSAQIEVTCHTLVPSSVRIDKALDSAAELEVFLRQELGHEANPTRLEILSNSLVKLELLISRLLDFSISPRGNLNGLLYQLNQLEERSRTQALTDTLIREGGTSLPEQEVYGVQFEFTKKAAKDFDNLQPYLQKKCNEFTDELKTVDDARHVGALWALEKLSSSQDFGSETYSIRLNQGYRVVFTIEDDHSVIIQRISKTLTHNN